MDISFLSLFIFIIVTILFYAIPSIGKPTPTIQDFANGESKTNFQKRNIIRQLFYLLIIVVTQFFLNIPLALHS